MNISSIGIQQILRQTGAGGENPSPAPDRNNDYGSESTPCALECAPAAAGTGTIVDKMA